MLEPEVEMPTDPLNESVNEVEDLNKFTNLCAELECALASTYGSLDEVLALKDILLEQSLPCSLKVKLTLALGRLHRSMSDLGVPTGEVTRLVKLYAVPWENKSKALKKLHQDYESKQHQLEIALKRLEMVGVQSLRMEKERRILNWEKLFAKQVGSRGHGQRWRFLIHQFKAKLQRGDNLAEMYAIGSDDEEDDSEINGIQKGRGMPLTGTFRERMAIFDDFPESKSNRGSNTENNMPEEIDNAHSVIEEESETSIALALSDKTSVVSNEEETLSQSSSQVPKKVRFDDTNIKEEKDTNTLVSNSERVIVASKRSVETVDKKCWTHEPDIEDMFHIRIYKTVCTTVPAPWCMLSFDKEVRKSAPFKIKEAKIEPEEAKIVKRQIKKLVPTASKNKKATDKGDKDSGINMEPEFQEFIFKLPSDFDSRNPDEVFLKMSVHHENKKTMVAMITLKLSDLMLVEDPGTVSGLKGIKPQPTAYELKSAVNNSTLIFNKPCGEIELMCFYSRVFLPKVVSRGTETLSIEELTDRIIDMRKKEFAKRLKSAGTSMTEKPIYTEDQMKITKDQLKSKLQELKEEYEERLGLMISELNKENTDDIREFVNTATSPLFMWSSSGNENDANNDAKNDAFVDSTIDFPKAVKEPVKEPAPKSPKAPKKKLRQKTEPVWGENLPTDFYERMEMFQDASQKYHQQLKEKFYEQTNKEIEQQLASQNRLDKSSNSQDKIPDDICLPALFMPPKTKNIYSSKARSYFHAFGSQEYRITQPPSIFQLPRLKTTENNSGIIGLQDSLSKDQLTTNDLDDIPNDQSDAISLASTAIEICDTDKI